MLILQQIHKWHKNDICWYFERRHNKQLLLNEYYDTLCYLALITVALITNGTMINWKAKNLLHSFFYYCTEKKRQQNIRSSETKQCYTIPASKWFSGTHHIPENCTPDTHCSENLTCHICILIFLSLDVQISPNAQFCSKNLTKESKNLQQWNPQLLTYLLMEESPIRVLYFV